MNRPIYKEISNLLHAIANCAASGNTEWQEKHSDKLEKIIKECLPSGSGFDAGTSLDTKKTTPEKLVFRADYRHMNDMGMYDGWTEHEVIIEPEFLHNFSVRVTGRNRRDIKEYIAETFYNALSQIYKEER